MFRNDLIGSQKVYHMAIMRQPKRLVIKPITAHCYDFLFTCRHKHDLEIKSFIGRLLPDDCLWLGPL